MKRLAVAIVALVVSVTAFAEGTQRYLVATHKAFRAGGAEALRRVQLDPVVTDVTPFESFNGFAAALTSDEVARLRASGEVRWIEPVLERRAAWIGHQTTPWGLQAIHAPQAREALPQGEVNVVVIDTGVDGEHPELAGVYAGGYDFFTGLNVQKDVNGHGTHVAGTIAAADNESGVVGVSPNVRLWAVKVLADDGIGSTESVIGGIDWVVKKKQELGGNWIANLSLSSSEASPGEKEAFDRAAAAGVLVFAAAGNASTPVTARPVHFPAAYASVYAVGATTPEFARARFSNQGPELDFVAPGTEVISTVPRGSSFLAYVKHENQVVITSILRGSKIGAMTGEYVYCGLGRVGDFPASVAGKIALMQRGEIKFMEKTRNAKAAGATAVVIFNNEEGAHSWTLYADEAAETEEWPIAIALSRANGEPLAAKGSGTLALGVEHNDYDAKSGTSMATPHVAGAAAFLWSLAPDASGDDIVSALRQTAGDLGDRGFDNVFGHGAIDLYGAARLIAPNAFSSRPTTGRTGSRRGGK